MIRKICLALGLAAVGLMATALPSFAQTTVTTDPVGFITTNCLSNSSTFLGNPFTRPAEFVGAVASVSGSTLVVSGTPGWTGTSFSYVQGSQPKTYYALFGPSTSGTYAREGASYTVAASSSNSLTLALNGDDISSLPVAAQVSVIPYWTLNTMFPATDANVSFTPTTSTLSMKTQVLIPYYSGSGINLSPNITYFYYNKGTNIGWRVTGDNVTDHGDDVLIPNGYIIVRNQNSAPTLPLTQTGAVYTKKIGTPIFAQASVKQDNFVSHGRPVDVALKDLGLSPTLGPFTATTSTLNYKDQIYLYDNTTTVLNKSPSTVYFWFTSGTNNGWRITGDNSTDRGSDVVPAGSAIIIRRSVTAGGVTTFWPNSPTF